MTTIIKSPTLTSNRVSWPRLITCSIVALIIMPGCSKQSKAEDFLKRAEASFAAKNFATAEIEYLNVLKLDKANVLSVKRLATIYYGQEKIQKAIPYLLGVRELDKEDLDARGKLAQLFFEARKLDDARTEAIYILERDPKDDDAITLLADTCAKPQDIADTRERLEQMKAQTGERASWHLAMAKLLLRKADYPAAEAEIQKASALDPKSGKVQLVWSVYYLMQNDRKNAGMAFEKAAQLEPLDPAACLRLAQFKQRSGFPKEGREILEQFAAKATGVSSILLALAKLDFDEKRLPECSKIVEQLLSKDPENYQTRLMHARLTRLQGSPANAVKEAEELRKAFGMSPEVSFELAQAHIKNQDTSNALASVEEALKLSPEFPEAALLQAELLSRKGDFANTLPLLQSFVNKYPENNRAQMLLAGVYTSQGRFDDALSIYRPLEQQAPKNPDIPLIIGMTLLRQPNGKAEARKAFDRAAVIAPNDIGITSQIVELEILEKNYSPALERIQSFLTAKPKSAGGKLLEARIYLAQENTAEAEAASKTAIEWDPNFAAAYELLVKIYYAGNRLAPALESAEAALSKNSKNVRALTQKALILERQGENNKAAASYDELLKIAPDSISALNNLALLLSEKMGKYDEALSLATRARSLAPENQSIAETLGWIQFRRREYSHALALLQESAVKLFDRPTVQFHLGMAYYMTGQEGPAIAVFKKALSLEAEFPDRAEAQKRLDMLNRTSDAADPATISNLLATIQEKPDDLPSVFLLGRIYEQAGDADKARQLYEEARKINPKSAPLAFRTARLFATKLKNPQQALALAKEARKLAPEDFDAAFLLGRLADESGDHQWASDLLKESARKQPDNQEVLFSLAQSVYANGRVNEAEEVMGRAVASPSPPVGAANTVHSTALSAEQNKEGQLFLAMIALSKTPEKRTDAEAHVQQLLKERPTFLPALMVSGLIHEQRGQVPEARQIYENIVASTPSFAPARKQLAGIYTDHVGDQKRALEQGLKARETLSEDSELAKTLGKIAYRQADFPTSVRLLQESSLKRTDDAEVFYFLGMAHYKKKVKEAAKLALEQSLALKPDASFAADAKKIIVELNQ